MRKRTVVIGLLALVPILWGGVSQAADNPQGSDDPFAGTPWDWNVRMIIRPFVSGLTRHYNLDEKQEKFTELLMMQRVKRFLGRHDRDVRALFTEYLAYQTSGQMPPREAAKEFARRARPMLSAIHKEIVDGNMTWRKILNEEQRGKHDRDLNDIDKRFKQYDEQFTRWSKGQVGPDDFAGTVSQRPRRIMKFEDTWTYYVRRFIEDYRLDQSQRETAYSILRQLHKEASDYREARKSELAELDAQYEEIVDADPKTDPDQLERVRKERLKLDARRERLVQPISTAMFNRLKQKLQTIPRADQRQAYDQRRIQLKKVAAEARAAYEARIAGTQPAPATRPASTTQPADRDAPTTAPAKP